MLHGKIAYSYAPDNWSQDEFLRLGGFTVVFLNYNKKEQIRESVNSALNQDFPLLEMFFMDDASSDGSAEVMETIVRDYHGRHKVTVVRNKVNQRITGQWNQVSKLATGNWYGMFCADDIANPDRVTKMAERIREYPTLLGLCSSGIEYDYKSGAAGRHISSSHELKLFRGTDSLAKQVLEYTPICGATAFWHKSLFEKPLPFAPYDDELLRWIILFRGVCNPDPVWLWDGSLETITYGVGTGTSSLARAEVDDNMPDWKRWKNNVFAVRKYHKMLETSWRAVVSYYEENSAPNVLLRLAYGKVFVNSISNMSTFRRILNIANAVRYKEHFMRWFRLTVSEMFGLTLPALVICFYHRLCGQTYRDIAREVFGQ